MAFGQSGQRGEIKSAVAALGEESRGSPGGVVGPRPRPDPPSQAMTSWSIMRARILMLPRTRREVPDGHRGCLRSAIQECRSRCCASTPKSAISRTPVTDPALWRCVVRGRWTQGTPEVRMLARRRRRASHGCFGRFQRRRGCGAGPEAARLNLQALTRAACPGDHVRAVSWLPRTGPDETPPSRCGTDERRCPEPVSERGDLWMIPSRG